MDGIDFKNVITAAELVRLQWRPHGWVLWQMIPQGGITLLAGETASGKTFLGLDLGLGIASGRGKAWDMDLGEEIADKKIEFQNPSVDDTNTVEQTRPVPYNVQLKDPSQAQDDNPHRVRYFCGDADPNLVAERVLRLCRQLRGWRVPTPLLRNKLGYCQAFEFGRRRGRCEVS